MRIFALAFAAYLALIAWALSPLHQSPAVAARPMQLSHFGNALVKWSYGKEHYAAWCAGSLTNCRIVLAPGYRASHFTTCPQEDGTDSFCAPSTSKEYLHP